jgi:hypothetical protein
MMALTSSSISCGVNPARAAISELTLNSEVRAASPTRGTSAAAPFTSCRS